MRRIAAPLLIALLLPLGAAGCDFFKELESVEDAGEEDTEGIPDRYEDDCTLEDDFCGDQDFLQSCDFSTGETLEVDCGLACGPYINFTCTRLYTGQHACWCVETGTQKIDSCSQLEQCLGECGAGATEACGLACFERTTTNTARLYGALVHCAESECEDICTEYPESCASCVVAARSGAYGSCAVERNVCDADDNDEPDWP